MRIPRTILTFIAMLCITPLLQAQYVRISNTEGIAPNGGMSPPTVLKSTLALYTDEARAHGVEGTVTVEAVMGEDGRIIKVRVLKGLGFGLDENALASVQEWAFSPATKMVRPYPPSLKLMFHSVCEVQMLCTLAMESLRPKWNRELNRITRRPHALRD